MNAEEREYERFLAESRVEAQRRWHAPYTELVDVIDAKRALIAEQQRRNEKRWFCPIPGCAHLLVREQAPKCPAHLVRMHELASYPERAR